jgi:hypothetical protein
MSTDVEYTACRGKVNKLSSSLVSAVRHSLKVQSSHSNPEAFNLVNVSGGLELFSTGNSQLFARFF